MTLDILNSSMTYTITLQEFPGIPEDTRMKAEEQYAMPWKKRWAGPMK